MNQPGFADIAFLPEDDRIEVIGKAVTATSSTVLFCVDDEPGKPDRYIRKLLSRFPHLEVVDRFKGPTKGAYSVKVRVRPEGN